MAIPTLDFEKLPSNRNVTVWLGPTGSIANLGAPTAAELNAMVNASVSISWNDYDFGLQASETASDPSLADDSSYEDFAQSNFGGGISFYYPRDYDDNSNNHSLVYDLTDIPWTALDVAVRVDGAVATTVPAANGDFVSTFAVMTDGEQNTMTVTEAIRRTVAMLQQGDFAHYTVVGPHAITATPATVSGAVGAAARIVGRIGGRDVTNSLEWRTDDAAVVDVSPGGVYRLIGVGTAQIEARDPHTGTTATVAVTVA